MLFFFLFFESIDSIANVKLDYDFYSIQTRFYRHSYIYTKRKKNIVYSSANESVIFYGKRILILFFYLSN